MATKFRESKRNVFRDLGFDVDASENLQIRSDLMIELSELIRNKGWTQAQAAELMGVSQPRISDLVRGKIDRFSIDSLIAMLGSAGVKVRITTTASRVA
ncbi:MAG: helix-turn-helix transcriptional regulator [Thermoanaerobaculia bacterium]